MSEQVLNVRGTMWHPKNTGLSNELSARVLDARDFPPPGNPSREEMARAAYRRKMGIKNLGQGYELRVEDTADPPSHPIESNADEVAANFQLAQQRASVDPLIKAVSAATVAGVQAALASQETAKRGEAQQQQPASPLSVKSEAPEAPVSTMSRPRR